MPKVAITILNYNSAPYTADCIKSLLQLQPAADWIIVIDNASTDDSVPRLQSCFRDICENDASPSFQEIEAATPDAVRKFCAENLPQKDTLWFVKCPYNKGYSGGNNLGITLGLELGADAVWILNNDTVVTPPSLNAMQERLFSSPRPGLCGSLIVYTHTPDRVQCRAGGSFNRWTGLSRLNGQNMDIEDAYSVAPEKIEEKLDFIYGASVMASREFIETVGLMDEGFFMYCEEQDWAHAANGRFDLVYAPEAIVYHHEGASTGWPGKTTVRHLLRLTKSRLRLTAKHTPAAIPVVCGFICFAAARLACRKAASHVSHIFLA